MVFVAGVIVGVAGTTAAALWGMRRWMLVRRTSPLDVDHTVERLCEAARNAGWSVPKVYDLTGSIRNAGEVLEPRVRVISLCKPAYAARVLGRGAYRRLAGIMPCRIAVYEEEDGSVTVAQMNTGLLAPIFGRWVGRIMARVTEETEGILGSLNRTPSPAPRG
ncbi:DUF302 domain-containing protein [Deferrisoma sp.]